MGVLQKLGFSEGESRVYDAILNSDSATLQQIHENTGLERRNVYDIINKLISKGLVSYCNENKHKIYRAADPKALMEYFDDQQKQIQEKKAELKSELPLLLKKYRSSKPEFDVRIYRGKEGVKSLFNAMLEYKDHYYIGGNWGIVKYVGKQWWSRYTEKRIARKIMMHDIVTVPKKFLSNYDTPKEYYEVKTLPPEFGSPNVIAIFGNCVANLFWAESLFAFVIEGKEIAKNYKDHFEYLWKTLR